MAPKETLDRAFVELARLIEAEGGTVEQYVGDAIHAVRVAVTPVVGGLRFPR